MNYNVNFEEEADKLISLFKELEEVIKNECKRYAIDTNEKNISFLGYRNNLRENLSSYDIGVICSKSEGFGRVTAEYMAAELCVIASDTGANTELIENEKNGLIYNYNNDKELAEKIKKIYNNKKLIDIYGKNARDTIIEKLTKEINADNIKKIYLRGKRG